MANRSPIAADERVVHHLRTHAKALVLPALGVLMFVVIGVAAVVVVPAEHRTIAGIIVAVLLALALAWFVGGPFLKWRSRTYTVTDRRIITRAGVLNRTGHDIQLRKVNAVSYDRSLTDRIFDCGTLRLDTASQAGVVVLPDVPDVERVHLDINELLFGAEQEPKERRAGR